EETSIRAAAPAAARRSDTAKVQRTTACKQAGKHEASLKAPDQVFPLRRAEQAERGQPSPASPEWATPSAQHPHAPPQQHPMKKLDGEDTRQQKHLPGLEQAQIRGQEKFGNEQAVLIVLAPEPRKRKRVLAVCNNRDLCPTVRVGEAGVAAKYRVRGDADCDDPAQKNKPR